MEDQPYVMDEENRTFREFLLDFANGRLHDILGYIPWNDHEAIELPSDDGTRHVLHVGRLGSTLAVWSVGFDERNVMIHSHDDYHEAADCLRRKVAKTRERVADIESGAGLPPGIRQFFEMLQAAGGPGVDVNVIEMYL